MTVVFEDYRGFDISDKIQAMKLDEENIKTLFSTLAKELPKSTVELQDILGAPKLTWNIGRVHYGARPGDYIIKDPADGYLPIAGHVFEKNFARDI